MNLLQTWTELFPDADLDTVMHYWRELLAQYGEAHREYHGIAHIEHMWEAQDAYFPDLDPRDARAVRIGVAFHDWFNHPFGHLDERRSAEAVQLILPELQVEYQLVGLVAQIVIDTEDHFSPIYHGAVLCDLDLLSLGTQPHIYQAGTAKIHREYVANCGVPETAWNQGRRHFIKRFLKRDRIYQTERVYDLFEAAARHNLQDELDALPTD